MSAFDSAWAWLTRPDVEGVHSDDPDDPGGDTWYGISRENNPTVPWPPTEEQAKAIAKIKYWDYISCDKIIQPALAISFFDCHFNQGPQFAVTKLQTCLGLEPDGIVGPNTINRANTADLWMLLYEYSARRALQYSTANPKFRIGLLERLFKLQRYVLSL